MPLVCDVTVLCSPLYGYRVTGLGGSKSASKLLIIVNILFLGVGHITMICGVKLR